MVHFPDSSPLALRLQVDATTPPYHIGSAVEDRPDRDISTAHSPCVTDEKLDTVWRYENRNERIVHWMVQIP